MAKKRSVKKQKPGRPRKVKPRVVAIVLCDSVMTDASSQKQSLLGVFDRIVTKEPTKPFPRPFFVFSKLFGGTGKWKLQLEVESPSGKTQELGEKSSVSLDGVEVLTGITQVRHLVISENGVHNVYQTVDGERIGSAPLIGQIHEASDG